MDNLPAMKPKSFWKKPEGVTGTIVLAGLLIGGGIALYKALPYLITLASNLLYLSGMLLVLGAIIYMVLDPRMRNLVGYMYKSVMRFITGIFITIDPIGILKNYVEDLKRRYGKMSKEIGDLMGQTRKLKTIMEENDTQIRKHMSMAKVAKQKSMDAQVALSTRAAARLQEANENYKVLLSKMDILQKVLKKMYEAAGIVIMDTEDQIKQKEVEYKMIRTSHGAMKSAMNIISGGDDQKALFDQSMDHILDDMANKVGEMERFMELSKGFMDSVDLQQGVFEEEGMRMLEQWSSQSLLLQPASQTLDLNQQRPEAIPLEQTTERPSNHYDEMFREQEAK